MTSLQYWHSKIRVGRRNFVVEQNFEWVLQKKKRIISYKITLASYWLISKLTSAKFSNFEKNYGHMNWHKKSAAEASDSTLI